MVPFSNIFLVDFYVIIYNSIQIAPSNAIVEVPVGKGGNPKGKSSSSIELSTRVLILFNTANVEQYDLMPSDCYSLDVASITLDKAEKSGMFTVKIDSNALASLKSGNYAIPLRLKSDHNVRKGADTVVLTYKKR